MAEAPPVQRVLLLGDAQSVHMAAIARALRRRSIVSETVSARPPLPGYPGRVHVIGARSHPRFLLDATRCIRRLLRDREFDVVNAHYATRYGLVARLGAGSVPSVVSVWGSDVQSATALRPHNRLLLRFVLSGATVIGATSASLADSARANVAAGHPVVVTPFGADLDLFSPSTEPEGGFTVVSVRGYSRNYGFGLLVEAFRRVVDEVPDARLVLVGSGESSEVAEMVTRLGLDRQVRLRPAIPHDEVPSLLASAHVAAVPSVGHEGFGVFAVEAAASGRPVVASRLGGLAEVVDHERTGFLVPPGDPPALADRLIELATDAELRQQMGTNARRRAEARFDVDVTVKELLAAYRLAVERVSVPGRSQ